MNWLTTAAVITAIVTVLNLLLNFWLYVKGRSAQHRDVLYKKQLDAYERIFMLLVPLHQHCINAVFKGKSNKLETYKHFTEEIMKSGEYDELLMEFEKTAFYLSTESQNTIAEYLNVMLRIAFGNGFHNIPEDQLMSHLHHKLGNAYADAIKSARHSIGVEAMSKEILAVTGTSYQQAQARNR